MKYKVNFLKGENGNTAKQGQLLKITIPGSKLIDFGIYKGGYPIIIGQESSDAVSVVLKRKGLDLKGQATLKVVAYNTEWQKFSWIDEFYII